MSTVEHLAAALGVIALGLVFLAVLGLRGRARFVLAAIIGVATGMLAAPALPVAGTNTGLAMVIAGGAVVGLFAALMFVALLAFDRAKLNDTIGNLATDISPSHWKPPLDGVQNPAQTRRDVARRWYVAVGAATGATVGCLVTLPEFRGALLGGFSGPTLFAVAVTTVASTVLLGPMQAYVTGADPAKNDPAEAAASLGWFDFDNMTTRAALRMALVAALLLAVSVLFNSLQQAIETASFMAAATIVLASLAPGIVSWYWSAALQRGVPAAELPDVSAKAAASCGAAVLYPWGVMAVAIVSLLEIFDQDVGDTPHPGISVVLAFSPLLGMVVALLFAFVLFGLPAFIGGVVLERFRGWPAMAALAVALISVTLVINTLLAIALWVFSLPHPFDWSYYGEQVVYTTLGMIGWVVGLTAGGFPQIVSRARMS